MDSTLSDMIDRTDAILFTEEEVIWLVHRCCQSRWKYEEMERDDFMADFKQTLNTAIEVKVRNKISNEMRRLRETFGDSRIDEYINQLGNTQKGD